jgi:glycerol-3-phosphate dehydrogenase
LKRDLLALGDRTFDLLVVGGGIHGVAAAWDAAERGLAVALVERDDFGSGVSWNSLKIIHGGLRYLQTADLVRLRESVRERAALLRIAPGLVKPLGFLVPTRGHGLKGREAMAAGLLLNDLLSADRNRDLPADQQIPRSRMLSSRETLAVVPGLSAENLNGGALWYDAQVESSERLTIGFAHAAASSGAVLANHVEAVGFLRDGSRVRGVRARDQTTGREVEVRARLTLNAAGPGALTLLTQAGLSAPPVAFLRAMNLVFARPAGVGLGVGAPSGGRFLFLVPWRGLTLVGTAYEPAEVEERADSVPVFLEEARRAFPWADLRPADLCLVHRGLVPGRGSAAGLRGRTLWLDHEADGGEPGLVSVIGVKFTTARGVAEAAVDLAARRLGQSVRSCRTAHTPLPRARPLAGTLEDQVREAVREEMAWSLGDALLRRLDIGTTGPPSEEVVERTAQVMAAELGWDEARLAAERRALAAGLPRMPWKPRDNAG